MNVFTITAYKVTFFFVRQFRFRPSTTNQYQSIRPIYLSLGIDNRYQSITTGIFAIDSSSNININRLPSIIDSSDWIPRNELNVQNNRNVEVAQAFAKTSLYVLSFFLIFLLPGFIKTNGISVTSRIIKIEVKVITRSRRLRLITLTKTLIILDITETESNNCSVIKQKISQRENLT